MNVDDIALRCLGCGGQAWIEEHLPDGMKHMEYYICCRDCDRETGPHLNMAMAKVEWDRMNVPDGVLSVMMEEVI